MVFYTTLEFWIVSTDFIGKIMIGIMALMVHNKISREKKIDAHVVGELEKEHIIGIISIILFIVSYTLTFFR